MCVLLIIQRFHLCCIHTEYEDLLSAGDTWTVTEFPVFLHNDDSDSANPSEIDLVQWMISGRGEYHIWDVSQGMYQFFYVRAFAHLNPIVPFLDWHTSPAYFLIE